MTTDPAGLPLSRFSGSSLMECILRGGSPRAAREEAEGNSGSHASVVRTARLQSSPIHNLRFRFTLLKFMHAFTMEFTQSYIN